jgi:hypothetical protein
MVAETLTANRAKAAIQAFGHGISGNLKCAYGSYPVLVAALEAADIFEMCWLPARALVVGGVLYVDDLDTGTETVDIDLGWAANGAGTVNYTAADGTVYANAGSALDADGFVNSGVLTGDAITDLLAAGTNIRLFPMLGGFRFFAAPTKVQATVVATQATPQAGNMHCAVLYVVL